MFLTTHVTVCIWHADLKSYYLLTKGRNVHKSGAGAVFHDTADIANKGMFIFLSD